MVPWSDYHSPTAQPVSSRSCSHEDTKMKQQGQKKSYGRTQKTWTLSIMQQWQRLRASLIRRLELKPGTITTDKKGLMECNCSLDRTGVKCSLLKGNWYKKILNMPLQPLNCLLLLFQIHFICRFLEEEWRCLQDLPGSHQAYYAEGKPSINHCQSAML